MLKLFLVACFTVNVLVDSVPLGETIIEARIIGGKDIDISQVPYHVAEYERNTYICGGFIVSPTHVVTSGTCVVGIEDTDVVIRAGSSSIKEGGVTVKSKKLYLHPKWEMWPSDYDVAVIELQSPLKFNNKTIKPIKLATKEPGAGSAVTISGWGCTNENLEKPKQLQSVTFPVYDKTKCAAIYKGYNITLTPRMICAGEAGKSAFHGDLGGALVYKGEVAGIVSFGEGSGQKDLPGIYTNIADPEIAKFIKSIAKL